MSDPYSIRCCPQPFRSLSLPRGIRSTITMGGSRRGDAKTGPRTRSITILLSDFAAFDAARHLYRFILNFRRISTANQASFYLYVRHLGLYGNYKYRPSVCKWAIFFEIFYPLRFFLFSIKLKCLRLSRDAHITSGAQ